MGSTTTPSEARERRARARRYAGGLALGLFALYLGAATPRALIAAWEEIADGIPHLGESSAVARRRTLGAPYTEAVAGIRRDLAPGSLYVLINADDKDEGVPLWVRFDLAPHPAIFLGHLSQMPPRVRRAFPRGPQPVVLTFGDREPPRLIDKGEFLDWFETPGRSGPPPGREGGSAPRSR